MLFCKHHRPPQPATWATQRPLRWLWEEERSPPTSLQEENQRERQIKLYNDRNSTPLMILYPMPLLDCFVNPASVTYLSDLFLSETWGTRAKNDLFYLWRLLLLDRRICTSPCHLWINLYGSTDLALIKLVKIQTPSSLKLIWDRLTEEGRGADTRENAWKR